MAFGIGWKFTDMITKSRIWPTDCMGRLELTSTHLERDE